MIMMSSKSDPMHTAIEFPVMVSATAMPIGPFDCSASDFFRNEIHRLVSVAVLAAPTVHGFADKLDLGHAYSGSSDSRDPSINECAACWPPVLILFQRHWCGRRTVDSDIVQSMHWWMTTAKRFCASDLTKKKQFWTPTSKRCKKSKISTFLGSFTFTVE